MYITDFEYANQRLSDLGYVVCKISTSSGIEEVNIGCDITFNTVKNNNSSRHYNTSSYFDDVYSTTFEISKNTCGLQTADLAMSDLEVRQLTKWLNRRDKRNIKKFIPYNRDIISSELNYFGSFNVNQIEFNGKIIGLKLTFVSDSPYALGEENSICITTSENNETFFIYGDGDDIGQIIKPKVIIKCLVDGDLKITNKTTKNEIYIANCINGEEILLDGEHGIIYSYNEFHNNTISSDFNYGYFDIQIDDGSSENEYEISIPCSLVIKYAPPRKVGVS